MTRSSMMDELFEEIVGYCSTEERSDKLKKTFLDPVLDHFTNKFVWIFRAIQAVAVLILLQFIFTIWVLVRSYRANS